MPKWPDQHPNCLVLSPPPRGFADALSQPAAGCRCACRVTSPSPFRTECVALQRAHQSGTRATSTRSVEVEKREGVGLSLSSEAARCFVSLFLSTLTPSHLTSTLLPPAHLPSFARLWQTSHSHEPRTSCPGTAAHSSSLSRTRASRRHRRRLSCARRSRCAAISTLR